MLIRITITLVLLVIASLALPAAALDVHTMVFEKRILTVTDNKQLTSRVEGKVQLCSISPDGRHITVLTEHEDKKNMAGTMRFSLVKTSDGRSITLTRASLDERQIQAKQPVDLWIPEADVIAWSPNSKYLACGMIHANLSSEQSEYWIVVYNTSGGKVKAFPLEGRSAAASGFLWSPSGQRLAIALTGIPVGEPSTSEHGDGEGRGAGILLCDVQSGHTRMLTRQEGFSVVPEAWSPDGRMLTYLVHGRKERKRFSLSLDGTGPVEIAMPPESRMDMDARPKSPDGIRRVDSPGIKVTDITTRQSRTLVKNEDARFLCWSANGKLILFGRDVPTGDVVRNRDRTLSTLWIVAADGTGEYDHLCVASDVDGAFDALECDPTMSADGMKVAYTSHGRVCVAELGPKDASGYEKAAAGLPLTPEEERELLMNSAKQIGTGLMMYSADYDDKFPGQESFTQDLLPYLQNNSDIFCRPGTQDMIFQYFPPGDITQVKYPAETVMGIFECTGGGRVILYVDGHVRYEK